MVLVFSCSYHLSYRKLKVACLTFYLYELVPVFAAQAYIFKYGYNFELITVC